MSVRLPDELWALILGLLKASLNNFYEQSWRWDGEETWHVLRCDSDIV